MKGGRRQNTLPPATVPSPPPVSPTIKATAKYTNKDGSKFITVPKPIMGETHQPSPQAPLPTSLPTSDALADAPAPGINKKKAKRRAKAAAKAKAEQDSAEADLGVLSGPRAAAGTSQGQNKADYDSGDRVPLSDALTPDARADELELAGKSKKARKKKKKSGAAAAAVPPEDAAALAHAPHDHIPATPSRLDLSKEKIWNTTSQEEREGIREFWLSLSEEARKSLVKVEKDAVLKKMKEQQKHTCGCTVCGRKRSAIEEELEGLYDAYYEELEQYAHDPSHPGNGPPMMAPPRHYDAVPSRPLPADYPPPQPSRGRIVEHVGDEEDEEDEADEADLSDGELDDEEDEEDYSGDEEDIPPDELHRGDYASEFFNFGNSLTVQGGILTVADDLLKNDGKKFIEMMEQLAERRMAREEDVRDQYQRGYGHTNGGSYGHNAVPSEEEEDYPPEEEDEDYTSQDDDYEEEEDAMTEDQRMEEGRRMFQIFAARMFEQRVLNAYREKVARERQEQLIREIENDERKETEQMAKKAKDAQKRKDKAAQKKQVQAEEKARKEADKAAEAAQRLAEEARRAEEQRTKAEEKRRKKEAQKKAEDDERQRREADRQRRAHEQKERQAEQERKAREAKEREKKTREEARLREQEARERKEREARERKEKQDKDKREKEAKARANEAKEKQKQAERAAQKAAVAAKVPTAGPPIVLAKRPSQQPHGTVPALPQQPPAVGFASPQIPVATPALPKGPSPMKARGPSQQGSNGVVTGTRTASQTGSAPSQNPSPHPTTPVHASPGPTSQGKGSSAHSAVAHPSQAVSPPLPSTKPALHPQAAPFGGMPPMSTPFPGPVPPVGPPPGFGPLGQYAPLGGGNYRAPGPMPPMSVPPGMGGSGRGFGPLVPPPPGFGQPSAEPLGGMGLYNLAKEGSLPSSHSRQPSDSFDSTASPAAVTSQPIARPGPIGRPTSVVHGQRAVPGSPSGASKIEAEDPHHLGSKALLEGSETALDAFLRRPGIPSRPAYGGPSFNMDPSSVFSTQSPIWNNPVPPMGHGVHHFGQAAATGFPMAPWPAANVSAFAPHGSLGRSQPRSSMLRRLLCEVCKDMAESSKHDRGVSSDSGGADGFLPLDPVKSRVEALAQQRGEPFHPDELSKLYDTEGDGKNGGGIFEVRRDSASGEVTAIRWIPDQLESLFSRMRKVGEISSPVLGSSSSDRDDSTAPWGAPPGLPRQ